jgi:hypothetical protein
MIDDVPVRVVNADGRHIVESQLFLPTRLPEHV